MRAFHNDPKIKKKYLARVRAHVKADELIKGEYWEKGKGCAVGCTIHSYRHADYETKLGIPRILARLEDGIFEGLPNGLAKKWPTQFLEVIKPGADLSLVWPKFAVWLLIDPKDGIIRFSKTDAQKKAIKDIGDAYKAVVLGKKSKVDWNKLQDAAYVAAAAAYAAAYAAAADAAYAAAAAAYAADAAAYAAADAAYTAAADAKDNACIKQSKKLLELLKECK